MALIVLAFAIHGLCALLIQRRPPAHNQPALRLIRLVTSVAGLIYVFTPAMLSHDVFVYASYGRVLAVYHTNPYFAPLSAFPQDPFNALNYWANATAAYGPVWIYICSLWGFVLGPQALGYVLAFRLFALAMHLLNTWLVATTLRTSGQSSRVVLLGTLLYAWNPSNTTREDCPLVRSVVATNHAAHKWAIFTGSVTRHPALRMEPARLNGKQVAE